MHMRTLVYFCTLVWVAVSRPAWSQETVAAPEDQELAQAAPTPQTQKPAQVTPSAGQSSTSSGSVTRLEEFTVTRRHPTQAASSETIRARDYELRPHPTTQEILNNLPGLVAGQHAGGKAMQYFLRGFDNDHGTDIALFIDGVPVNADGSLFLNHEAIPREHPAARLTAIYVTRGDKTICLEADRTPVYYRAE